MKCVQVRRTPEVRCTCKLETIYETDRSYGHR